MDRARGRRPLTPCGPFEIMDDGIGAYANLLTGLNLGSEFEAVQELSKGSTRPTPHATRVKGSSPQ